MNPDQETIYPPRRIWYLLVLVPIFVFVTGLAVRVSVSGGVGGIVAGLVIVLMLAVPFGFFMLANLEGLRRRLPLARLDRTGVECSQGRLLWDDVESIAIVQYKWGDGIPPYVALLFRLGAHLSASAQRYYDSKYQMRPRTTDWALLIPVWTTGEKDISTVQRFCAGPVRDPITIEGDESTPLPANAFG